MKVGTEKVVECKDIFYSIGDKEIINGVSAILERGKFYVIIGPNGCGKTTLLDVIIGIKKPDRGEVLIRGVPLNSYRRTELSKILSLLPQSFGTFFNFRVYELVEMGRYPYTGRFGGLSDRDAKVVESVIKELELEDVRNNYVTDVSGGERQRALFGVIFAQDTPIIFLDEPNSNLDPYHSCMLVGKLKDMVKSREVTVLCVFQDLNLTSLYADYIFMMKYGRIIHEGSKEEVLTSEKIYDLFSVKARFLEDPETGLSLIGVYV